MQADRHRLGLLAKILVAQENGQESEVIRNKNLLVLDFSRHMSFSSAERLVNLIVLIFSEKG